MKTADLFEDAEGQVVRLPPDYQFPEKQVFIKKVGNAVMLIPMANPWDALFESVALFSDAFMDGREQPMQVAREDLLS